MSRFGVKDFGLEVAKGNIPGHTFIHKFGNAPDYDLGDGFVTVWDGAADGTTWEAMTYTYSTTADIQWLSSDAAGTNNIEIQGQTLDGALVTQTKALTGTTRVAIDTPLWRVFRMKNTSTTTTLAGNVFLGTGAVDGAPVGVPNTANQYRAMITLGNNQTLMCVYTIPAAKTGYMTSFYCSTHGANRTAAYDLHLLAREVKNTGPFLLKHTSSMQDDGTSHWNHMFDVPEVFEAGTDIEIQTNATATAGVTTASVSSGFDLILVDD